MHRQSAGDTTAIKGSQWSPVWHGGYQHWAVTIGLPGQAGGELQGWQDELAADKAALVHLLVRGCPFSRRVSLQQRISLVQCRDQAGEPGPGGGQNAGKDAGQPIQVPSRQAGRGRHSRSVPGARHSRWDLQSLAWLGGPGQWFKETAWRRIQGQGLIHYTCSIIQLKTTVLTLQYPVKSISAGLLQVSTVSQPASRLKTSQWSLTWLLSALGSGGH